MIKIFISTAVILHLACTDASNKPLAVSGAEPGKNETNAPMQATAVQAQPPSPLATPEKPVPEKAVSAKPKRLENTAKKHISPSKKTDNLPTANLLPAEKPVDEAILPMPKPNVEEAALKPVSIHETWDVLLQKYVSEDGRVNYKGLKTDKNALEAYCASLALAIPDASWSREAQMAYWINTYNAFTIKLIVDNYPTESILRFDGGKTWDVKRIKLADKKYSLNQIENEILRPLYKDPRIHFVINCAAKSCPPIYNHAMTAENIETVLDTRARAFVNDKKYNQLSANKAQISKIFDWYAVDFGEIHAFLNQYAETPISKSAAIRYADYVWDLND